MAAAFLFRQASACLILLSTGAFMMFIDVADGLFAELFQYVQVEVRQLFKVNAGLAHPVLSQLIEELAVVVARIGNIQGELGLPGREADQGCISFMTAGI